MSQKIEIGEEWTIKGMTLEVACFIRKIENSGSDKIIHVSLKHIPLKGDGASIDIDHMPFSEQAVLRSLDQLRTRGNDSDEDFEAAYYTWAEAKGGVWDVQIKEAIKLTLEVCKPEME